MVLWATEVKYCFDSSLCLIIKLLCVIDTGLGLCVIFREYNFFRCVEGAWGVGLINLRARIIC